MKVRAHPRQIQGLIALVLGFVSLLLYLPTLRHHFVEYDDQQYVTENARVLAGLTKSGFIWAFGFHASNWHPLAWLSHMLDCQVYGSYAGGHHLTNILLHTASTVLLFLVLNRMTGAMWRSAAVAALFGWHPLHVESVAWIAERKDVLCAFFWMLTLGTYARYAAKPAAGRYWTTLGCFALCLMAKPMGITLPFVLLLLDWWPLDRIADCGLRIADLGKEDSVPVVKMPMLKLFLEKIPFFILSGASGVLTILAQQQAIVSTKGLPVGQRFEHALVAYLHYLVAAFVPVHLAVYYPYQRMLPVATLVLAGALIVSITLLAVLMARRKPYLTVGWLWYLGTLVPVIGLVQVGDQAWADRYTYLPLIGLFVAVVWLVADLINQQVVLRAMALSVGTAMIVATSLQLRYWKDTRTLFEHALKVAPENYLAITVLGSELAKEGKLDEAMEHYRTAL
ncbi:MAG: Tetratricopeptide 2 repeat protein, partial [Pedosphaera sp.]|nr:Tetratricopeptide 2 repeat protein [Pedosphaera sp.]